MTAAAQRSRLTHDTVMNYGHSPHLAQWTLNDRLAHLVRTTVATADHGQPFRVLEVGASHGGFTEVLLAAGCHVTAVEMFPPSFAQAQATYATNDRFTGFHDPSLSLTGVGDGYSMVLCVSVLHHLPDYQDFLTRVSTRLAPDGALLTVQDPLWYPRVGRLTRTVDRSTYLLWRLRQGQVRGGAEAMIRRLRRKHPQPRVGHIDYYHVIRQGVDEAAVKRLLLDRFASVELLAYWSHHMAAMQRPADRLDLVNTFAARATGCLGAVDGYRPESSGVPPSA